MRLLIRLIAVLLVLVLLGGIYVWIELRPPESPPALTSDFRLTGVTVVNPELGRSGDRDVVVREGRIERIEPVGDDSGDGGLGRFTGRYLLPGLIDLHTHLPPDNALQLTRYVSLLYLVHGVTSVRDAGDVDGSAIPAARRGIEGGDFPGPRVFACGPFVAGGSPRWTNTVVLRDPGEADAAVAKIKADGFDCIKSYDDLTEPQIRALEQAAEKHRLPMLGHVPAALAYEEARIPDVQHFFGVPEPDSLARDHILNRIIDWQDVDEARLDRIVEVTREHGIVNTPTLVSTHQLLLYSNYAAAHEDPIVRLMPRLYRDVVWHPVEGIPVYRDLSPVSLAKLRAAFEKKKELARRLHASGAELRIGTDVQQPFVVPGASVHQEMRLFGQVGISPEEVWAIATWRAGEALGVPLLGRIEEGAPADLLIFRADPTRDMNALFTLEAVVVRGRLYPREDLFAAVQSFQEHFDGFVVDRLSVTLARRLMRRTIKRDY